jgi:hypothetical protein
VTRVDGEENKQSEAIIQKVMASSVSERIFLMVLADE